MQSDPQDEQSTPPESRDEEPQESVEGDQGLPPAAPQEPRPGASPPRMPALPQAPAGGPPPSAWGSPAPPATPGLAPPGPGPALVPPAQEVAPDAATPGPVGDAPAAGQPAPGDAPVLDEAGGTATEPGEAPAKGVVRPGSTVGVAPVVQGDWLASVCPYLTSEDGAYRSATPNEGHRCTAQDPAATLPLAFQERFCLTDRHPRCEMYKFAQETDASGGIPADKVPPTDPPTPRIRRAGGGGPNRPLLATLAGIAGVVIVVLLVVAFMGSCSGNGDSGADPDAVPDGPATQAPARTPAPTPAAEITPDAQATPDEAAGQTVRILYEIQPDEALLRVSETFGISRNRIRRENPDLEEIAPADLPGTIIELPIVGDMTLAEAEALPGFQGLVSDIEAAGDG